jgi:hypothetical protein
VNCIRRDTNAFSTKAKLVRLSRYDSPPTSYIQRLLTLQATGHFGFDRALLRSQESAMRLPRVNSTMDLTHREEEFNVD